MDCKPNQKFNTGAKSKLENKIMDYTGIYLKYTNDHIWVHTWNIWQHCTLDNVETSAPAHSFQF